MQPLLQIGSFGENVNTLQSALNLWPDSATLPLAVDSAFGPKTDGKVREYQRSKQLAVDGKVGRQTWESLQHLIDLLLKLVNPPADEARARERIKTVAETALGMFGWQGLNVLPDRNSPKIAAAICADESDPLRPRQGGMSLASIFHVANAGVQYIARCPYITPDAVTKWQESSGAATKWRTDNDLRAWCGIFCYYIYRCAGIDLGGWAMHRVNMWGEKTQDGKIQDPKFHIISNPAQVFKGCIGVEDGVRGGGRNHHFIVIENTGETIRSIDGNAFGPRDGDYSTGYKSVITRKIYTYKKLRANDAYFLFPKKIST
jgi:hypothetical protein